MPTLNAGPGWTQWLALVNAAVPRGSRRVVVDSASTDRTADEAISAGFEVLRIQRYEFNHGATRQRAAELLSDCDIIVFLTQDALLESPDSINNLVRAFENEKVGAAYGRQLPHLTAMPFGAHARLFNYPDSSGQRCLADIGHLGIKAAFISNSFAAYRRKALMEVGGFPGDVILGEDMMVAARMLLDGWCIAYVADAKVHHSHEYTMVQEFRRYFDIGVLHGRESWLLDRFGKPEGEGMRYVRSELRYLGRLAPLLIPSSLVRTIMKYAGYQLGRKEKHLPVWLKRRLSMHRGYWRQA